MVSPDEIRRQQLEEHIRETLVLIKEYEDKYRLSDDPLERRHCKIELAKLKDSLADYQAELAELQGRLAAGRAKLKGPEAETPSQDIEQQRRTAFTPPDEPRPKGRRRRAAFISYSSTDAAFAHRLAQDLKKANVNIWFDRWEIKVGDSISEKIEAGLRDSDYLIIVLSPRSVNSSWVRQELNAAHIKELEARKVVVLPALIEKCDVPLWLRDKHYADFRADYDYGLWELLEVLAPTQKPPPPPPPTEAPPPPPPPQDTTGPSISGIGVTKKGCNFYGYANISDPSGVAWAQFYYRLGGGGWQNVGMNEESYNYFKTGDISVGEGVVSIEYYVQAADHPGNQSESGHASDSVGCIK
jgi:hypothetical protein